MTKHGRWSVESLSYSVCLVEVSDYLIAEECHPVLFELDLVNPEVLPDEPVS